MSLTLESCKNGCVLSCSGGVGCPDAGAGTDKRAGGTSAPSSASKRPHDDALNDRQRKLHRGNGNNGASIVRREIASPLQTVLSGANNAAIPSAGNAPKGASGLAAQNCAATTQLQKSKKKKGFPKGAAVILNEWLMSHLNNPYPSEQEKFTLMEKTGIDKNQLCKWFSNSRSRRKQQAEKKERRKPAAAAAAAAKLEKTKQSRFENITRLENTVNELVEDNATKQKFIALMGNERELLTQWSIDTDLSDKAAVAEKQRHEAWDEVFQIERQAKAEAKAEAAAAKKEQRRAKAEAEAKAEAAEAQVEVWFPGIVHGKKAVYITLLMNPQAQSILENLLRKVEAYTQPTLQANILLHDTLISPGVAGSFSRMLITFLSLALHPYQAK